MQSEQEPTAFLHSEDGLNTGGVATIGRRNRPHESAMSPKKSKEYPKGILHELIKRIHEKAAPLMTAEEGTDILGHF